MIEQQIPRVVLDKPGRGRIYGSIIEETIGNTPMVRIGRLARDAGCQAEVLAKLEFFNPLASVKDRIAVSMLEAMEADGIIGPGSVIVEPTSGNTGIGLAFACAQPRATGVYDHARQFLDRTPQIDAIPWRRTRAHSPSEGFIGGAIEKAKEISTATEKAVMPWQFSTTRQIQRYTAEPRLRRSGATLTASSMPLFLASARAARSRASERC